MLLVWLVVSPLDFSIEEELLHPKVKNSTLLDVSNANNVHMEQPLDLSIITGGCVVVLVGGGVLMGVIIGKCVSTIYLNIIIQYLFIH